MRSDTPPRGNSTRAPTPSPVASCGCSRHEVVQSIEFETDDPAVWGEMTITYTLADADGGTDVIGLHENLPPGAAPADNELGWRMSLDKLARLVEHDA